MSSIHEVARQAGVSTATVSRTFSTPDLLSQQTRSRVLDVADRLNYRPRRRIVKSKAFESAPSVSVTSDCLGFLFFDSESDTGHINEFYTPVLTGAQSEAAQLGMHLIVHTMPRHKNRQELPKMFEEDAVAGMLFVGAALPEILSSFLPHISQAVLLDNRDQAGHYDCILSDGFGGMRAATEYLLSLGHRQIGFLQNEPTAPSFQDRLQGYLCAHFAAGLTPNPRWMVNAIPGQEIETFGALVCASDRPTALVAANDANALWALRACRRHGLDVPGDISVVGFDDMPFSQHAFPSLTTMRIDKGYMGRLAVRRLYERIHEADKNAVKPEPAVQITVPVSLVQRESCRALDNL